MFRLTGLFIDVEYGKTQLMKKIDTTQAFSVFLNSILLKSDKRNAAFTKTCDILYSLANSKEENSFKGLTLGEALEVDSDLVFKFRGIGPLGYIQLCEVFVGSNVDMSNKPFFRQYFILQKEDKLKKEYAKPPKVTIKAVRVRTDPETFVFSITINGGTAGEWKDVVNTSGEVRTFFKGLHAMACFAGMPPLKLPAIPKTE